MALSKKCHHTKAERRSCRCAWYWSGYIDGRRQYRNLGPDRTEARRLAARIEADRLDGKATPVPRDATLAAVSERWIDHLAELGRRPQSLRAYRTSANAVERYFGPAWDIRLIDAGEVAKFRSDAFASRRGHGGAHLMQALRGILNQAHREGLIPSVPQPPVERRTIAPNPNVLMSEAETNATIAALRPDHWRDMAEVILLTGLRVSEALALSWEDFDAAAGTLHVRHSAEQTGAVDGPTKTAHSTRRIRLEEEAAQILIRQPRADARIFPRRYGAALAAMRRAMERSGTYKLDRGWHSLRHTNTALRDRAGQSVRQAAGELGHGANFVMTASYGWAAEAAEPAGVSKVRQRHDQPSST